ncbi:putative polyketide synthase [Xylogone sp. PMI_703]|nr:putative polyketide synthase [Xylogone sp. PMI_703]
MYDHSSIAIIGVSYRAPGVGRKGLWEYLAEAKSAFSKVPADRFDQDAFYYHNPEKAGCFSSKGGHFLPDDVYAFDAPFFNLRPEEARAVDPHHRILLECALEAAESAGLSLVDIAGGNIGVFSAIGSQEYAQLTAEDLPTTTTWTAAGSAQCMFANRLSYFFDLAGPSISLDAACASSSYAVHMACQSLRTGECNMAFVGGSSLLLGPYQWSLLDSLGALSPDGKCFSYDKKASGFGRGEGAAFLIIKRLDHAIRDGDPIQAVIRSSATNHVGRSDGITMPRRSAHEALLRRVHRDAGLDPADTPVVEGHGTGTQVGDPIEAGAFYTVLASQRTPSNPLYIGSLKSNFGHLEGASGILAMVKAILMVQHGKVLPNALFEEMNANIEGRDAMKVAPVPLEWPVGAPRRVCVTNFGFGGSNAAVIIEEAPTSKRLMNGHPSGHTAAINGNGHTVTNGNGLINGNGDSHINGNGISNGDRSDEALSSQPEKKLFVFSAKSENSLVAYLPSLAKYLDSVPESGNFIRDLSYTLGQRRTHHQFRVAIAADSIASLKNQLPVAKINKTRPRVIAFVFTGQGAQYAQMASGLRQYKTFAETLDNAEMILQSIGSKWSLMEELARPNEKSRVNDAEISQPACTALQLALLTLLKSWGIVPAAVAGHSSGEIAAGFAAGLLSFEAAVAVAYFRGQAAVQLKHAQPGAMLALGAGAEVAEELLQQNKDGYATVAAINSPQSVTISGDVSAIEVIQKLADAHNLFARRVKVGLAYHSRHMEKVASSYLAAIQPFCDKDASHLIPDVSAPLFISSVTGSLADRKLVDASYWVKNLLQPVRFADAVEGIFSIKENSEQYNTKTPNVIVEIGPHSALRAPIKQTADSLQQKSEQKTQFTYLASLVRGQNGSDAILDLATNLYILGLTVNLGAINQTGPMNAHVIPNLPPYEWDKSARYTHKSRLAKQKLHPGYAFHPLLGWKSPYDDGEEVTFRQVFTLDEIPWIRDHKVSGQVIFPMTGYVSLAIEAIRRVAPSVPASILFRDFHAKRSLVIEEDERVDIVTKLKPAATGTEGFSSTTWFFEILSWSEKSGWTAHCHGWIEPEKSDMDFKSPNMKVSIPLLENKNVEERDVTSEYNNPGAEGTHYGPAFKTIDKFVEGDDFTILENVLRDMDLTLSQYGSPISTDPPTLDVILQGLGHLQEIQGKKVALMPNYVSRLRISNKIPADPKRRFITVTRRIGQDIKAGSLIISAVALTKDEKTGSIIPVADWEAVTFRSLGSSEDGEVTQNLPSSYHWDLIPDSSYLNEKDVAHLSQVDDSFDEAELQRRADYNGAAIWYIQKALKEIENDDISKMPSHFSKFVQWAKTSVNRKPYKLDKEPTELLKRVESFDAQGEMICKVGKQLVSILRGEIQVLEIMLKDGLLNKHYEQDRSNQLGSKVLSRFVGQMPDFKPDMTILEIGGGTASATLPVLQELSRGKNNDVPAFSSYTFTDISAGFFEHARNKLSKWASRITYKRLDISQDPVQQGFNLESYDLVIASNVLHATENMNATLGNVRSLLKPNGKLVVFEGLWHPPFVLPFALLPGWWLSSDKYRSEEGPLLPKENWQTVLSEVGFSGINGAIDDYPGRPEHVLSIMWSTRVGKQDEGHEYAPITICGPLMDNAEVEFVEMLADQIAEHVGCQTVVKPILEVDPTDDQYVVFVDSPRQSIFHGLTNEAFGALKAIFLESTSLLWILPDGHSPEAATAKGMLRGLRLESGPKTLLTLENLPCTGEGALAITKIARRLKDPEMPSSVDQDFFWHEGKLHLPRLRESTSAKEVFAAEASIPWRSMQDVHQDNVSLALTMDTAGSPDSIYFRRTNVLVEPVGDDEIVVQNEAAGVNFRDLLLVLGSIPWSTPGFEGVGKVLHTGSNVTDLKPGDRVFYGTLEGGSFATHVRMHHWRASKLPEDVSSVEAASIPVAYSTAVMAINRIGRLKKGETLLVHAASGAVGQACIVLAQHIGAEIYATAGSPAKRQFLVDTFNIPMDHIFSSRTLDFRDGVLSATDGRGVDVVVNSLSGNLLQETWSLMADFGRFVEIGKRDFLQNSHLAMKPFDRNVTFSGVDLRAYFEKKPSELRECLLEVVDLLEKKVIKPVQPVTKLPISQIATGLRKLQSGQNIGKIVITFGKNDKVLAETLPLSGAWTDQLLRPDATYLVTGGTGGIGLSLGPWMAENGARNIILLGRSGSSRPAVQKVLEQFKETEVNIRAIACDVGKREDVLSALEAIKDLPPVRGIIHGALYLRDSLLVNATFEDWQKITRPRIQGAWNLHELLPDVDFFINLSSFLGATGNIGQTIYSGTATFYDAFADYRLARGLPAVSIALPVVLGVGYVVDHDLTDHLKNSLGAILDENHLRTLIKGAIIGSSSGVVKDGKAMSFCFANGYDSDSELWACFHPRDLVKRIKTATSSEDDSGAGRSSNNRITGVKVASGGDPAQNLLEALISKVSSITMIDRDEIEADAPLCAYGLDSLVSVELRNWIRRETSVELPLPNIVNAENLRALSTTILLQTDTFSILKTSI